MNNMLFTRRNLTKAFAITIPILIFNIMSRPFEHLLNGVITDPTTEQAMVIVISSMIFTITVSVIAVLICIKIWNKQIPQIK